MATLSVDFVDNFGMYCFRSLCCEESTSPDPFFPVVGGAPIVAVTCRSSPSFTSSLELPPGALRFPTVAIF